MTKLGKLFDVDLGSLPLHFEKLHGVAMAQQKQSGRDNRSAWAFAWHRARGCGWQVGAIEPVFCLNLQFSGNHVV